MKWAEPTKIFATKVFASFVALNPFYSFSYAFISLEKACMVGERDSDQDAVRWELDDPTAISIPPPFNNGILQYNQAQQHQQHFAVGDDAPGHWDDEKHYGLMCGGDGGIGASEKGVRFPETSPTQRFYTGQLSHDPLQGTHSR